MDDDLWILDDGGDDVEELVGFLLSGDQRDQSTCQQRDFFFSFSEQRNALATGGRGGGGSAAGAQKQPARPGGLRKILHSVLYARQA